MSFPTEYGQIRSRLDDIDPVAYGRTRNYLDGAVTRLSPYISRGVLTTRQVMQHILGRGFHQRRIEKFLQELAWRDYWQQIWMVRGDEIDQDLRSPQTLVEHTGVPAAVVEASTGIRAVDDVIRTWYDTGYMHNHMRMYVASIACNIGRCHWNLPARWMYFHLLDGDWASNALSWQWVAGTNSRRKYVANQENINKYCRTDQQGTFLDVPYASLPPDDIPAVLRPITNPELITTLPDADPVGIDPAKPTLLYNSYQLDPHWHAGMDANRILLLEPSHFRRYPVSQKVLDFVLQLSANIPGMQVFTGDFADFVRLYQPERILFKEHPTTRHYRGKEEPREWMFDVHGEYRSFFAFWKQCRKQLKDKTSLSA